ncbi:DASH complex subunit spc19 [Ciborinia camelliae]|nr:DASH complex subunit spc19 [Ciborinia camelliae]
MNTQNPSTLLSSSVASLRSSLSTLDNSISILDSGISDFPRLKSVLSTTRHFELTPSTTLHAAQRSLAEELEPAIETLLARSESLISRLQRKEEQLIARSQLLSGRLESANSSTSHATSKASKLSRKKSWELGLNKSGGGGNEEKAMRLKVLRQKKERLGYAVERLGLQSQQRQRQLRMSIAPPSFDE